MTKKRTIDPYHYGVDGYSNVPMYNIPYTATGHLMYYRARDTHEALCGAPAGNLHARVVLGAGGGAAWAKVCARCRKVAERDGLVEWVMPPMRKGDCPVLSERAGKPTKHIVNPHRPRCKDCPSTDWNRFERCGAQHPTYGLCTACGYKEPDRHYCDFVVGRSMGISTQFGYCDKRATEERLTDGHHLGQTDAAWRWLCKQHLPESIQQRQDAREAKHRDKWDTWRAENKARGDKNDAFDILVDVARWVHENRDLAAEDEWLGQIAGQLAENQAVQDALSRKLSATVERNYRKGRGV